MGGLTSGLLIADRYRLVEKRSSGGTADVWLARDEVRDRHVAVKIPTRTTDLANPPMDVRAAMAEVRHPNLVAILDRVDSPCEALILEWVEGTDLRTVLDSGPLPIGVAVSMAIDLGDALDAMHRAGLVHRDVKPANILMIDDGTVKLTDFDTAVSITGSSSPTGNIIGTAKYMSPEQVRGHQLDGRSDTFSLAAVLYEAVTGRPPYLGVTDIATAVARLEQTPADPHTLRPEIPADLQRAIMQGLSLRPEDRWDRPCVSRPPAITTQTRRPIWPRIVGMSIALAVGALGIELVVSGFRHLTG